MDSLQMISLCTNLFYVFAGVAAASFLLSVYLFFKFDIPYTYSMLTGKAKKRTIEQMEKQKFQTGKLRMNYPTGNTGNTGPRTKKQGKTGGMTGHTAPNPPAAPGYSPAPAAYSPAPVTYAPSPPQPPVEYTPETQLLGMENPQTSVLSMDAPETQVLAAETPQIQSLREEDEATMVLSNTQGGPCTEDLSKTTILRPEPQSDFLFRVTEESISINTNELI